MSKTQTLSCSVVNNTITCRLPTVLPLPPPTSQVMQCGVIDQTFTCIPNNTPSTNPNLQPMTCNTINNTFSCALPLSSPTSYVESPMSHDFICTSYDETLSCVLPSESYAIVNEYSDFLGNCLPNFQDSLGIHSIYKALVKYKDGYGQPISPGFTICLDSIPAYRLTGGNNCISKYNGTYSGAPIVRSTTYDCGVIPGDSFTTLTAPVGSTPKTSCPAHYNSTYGYYRRTRVNGPLSQDIITANNLITNNISTYNSPNDWYCVLDPAYLNVAKTSIL